MQTTTTAELPTPGLNTGQNFDMLPLVRRPPSAVSGLKYEVKLRLVKDCLQITLVLTCCLKNNSAAPVKIVPIYLGQGFDSFHA